MSGLHSGLTGADLHESKGTAAAGAGSILIADGAGSASWQLNQVDFIGVVLSDSTIQTAPASGEKNPIIFDTNLVIEGVGHTAGSADFLILSPGFYQLVCIPLFVTGGGGAGSVEVSWEVNTGTGFTTIPGSATSNFMTALDEKTVVAVARVFLSASNLIRSAWATNSTNVNIQPGTSLVGDTIASARQFITHNGN
jgi:hypothetical protein